MARYFSFKKKDSNSLQGKKLRVRASESFAATTCTRLPLEQMYNVFEWWIGHYSLR